jgi:DNA-binding MarR family transcriptional regulator
MISRAATIGSVASAPDTEASYQSLALLDHLSRVARREADGTPHPDGLRPRHLVALTLLRDHGAATQQALSEALRLDPSNVVGLLNDLESRGLVTRRRDPDDRRRHIVELAPAGLTTLHEAEQRLAAVENRVLGALSAEERCTLHALLIRAAGGQLPATACTEPDTA